MKRIVAVFMLLMTLIPTVGCSSAITSVETYITEKNDIWVDYNMSYFDDFDIENNVVYIKCVLKVHNDRETCSVELKGFLPDDVGKLISDSPLVGYTDNRKKEECTFAIQNGTNTIYVEFRGSYAGTPQKANRLLPEITIIEVE